MLYQVKQFLDESSDFTVYVEHTFGLLFGEDFFGFDDEHHRRGNGSGFSRRSNASSPSQRSSLRNRFRVSGSDPSGVPTLRTNRFQRVPEWHSGCSDNAAEDEEPHAY